MSPCLFLCGLIQAGYDPKKLQVANFDIITVSVQILLLVLAILK